jgi:peptide/nickel transport system substrate-binding protein
VSDTIRVAIRVLWVAAVVAACGSKPVAGHDPVTLRVGIAVEPQHLLPLVSADRIIEQVVLGDVYEPLFTVDDAGQPVPVLARRVSITPDGTTVSVSLRPGVRWHDGTSFTAADVVFSLEAVGRRHLGVLADDFDDLLDVTATPAPDAVVTMTFKAGRPGRLRALALVPMVPVARFGKARDLLAAPAARAPVGTGPFRFASWTPGRDIVLVRAATYRGPPAAAERIVYRIIGDREQLAAQLEQGQLDLLLPAPGGSTLAALAHDPGVVLLPYAAGTYLAARWNCKSPRLADPRIRRALTMLLDRDAVVAQILAGRGQVGASPWPPGDLAIDPGLRPWPFDPPAARRALTGPLHVTLLVPAGSTTLERIATLWQADAAKAGVTLDLVMDPDVLGRARRGDFEGVLYAWSTGPEQDFFQQFATTGSDNLGGCGDPALDAALDRARHEPVARVRLPLERQASLTLHALEPVTIIAHDQRVIARRAHVRGVSVTAGGLVPLATVTP